jgi:hypothetical protein
VPGAECPEGSAICVCKIEGLGIDFHTFTCTGVSSHHAEKNYVVLVSIWLSAIALLALLLTIVAYIYRRSAVEKKDVVMEEYAERRAKIVQLQDLVHEFLKPRYESSVDIVKMDAIPYHDPIELPYHHSLTNVMSLAERVEA